MISGQTALTLAAMWDETSLAGVRLLILAGEACREQLGWRLAGASVEHLRPTEATVVTTAAPIRPGNPMTIGWPLDGWETAVVDEELRHRRCHSVHDQGARPSIRRRG